MASNPPAIVVYFAALGLAIMLALICAWTITTILKRRKQTEMEFVSAITLNPVEALETLKDQIVSMQTSAMINSRQALQKLGVYLEDCRLILPDLSKDLSIWQQRLDNQSSLSEDETLIFLMNFQRWVSKQIVRLEQIKKA